ncbi:MAG: Ig-like domain-containing protein, partial [Nitrospira sp.]|nr:Ig-like domain-containing protein [Nitrospira sp.]
MVELIGGEPQISLDQHMVKIEEGVPTNVGFTANEVGPYTVIAMGMNPEDVPVKAGAPRVNTETGVIETTYNRATNKTEVQVPVKVTDSRGNPVRDVPVDVAISTKSSVEYIEVNTNRSGIGIIETSFTGQHEASSISAQIYRVPGYAWKQDFPCDCDIKNLRVVKDGEDKPQVEYIPEKNQDRITFKFKILADIETTAGKGKVTVTTSEKVDLWLYKGTLEDRDKMHKLRKEGEAAFKAGKEKEAKEKFKEADDLWKKLKPEKIDIKQEEKKKEEPQELECDKKYDWSYEPEGEFWWEGENYRIGTA